jgi:hypothetical protein
MSGSDARYKNAVVAGTCLPKQQQQQRASDAKEPTLSRHTETPECNALLDAIERSCSSAQHA